MAHSMPPYVHYLSVAYRPYIVKTGKRILHV